MMDGRLPQGILTLLIAVRAILRSSLFLFRSGVLQLAIVAGGDFSTLLLQTMAAEPIKPVDSYRIVAKSR